MPDPRFLRVHPLGTLLLIKAQPRASKNQIGDVLGDELKVKISAPPVDAAANEALVLFLAEQLKCPRRAVRLLRGQTSRHKQILVEGLTPENVLQRLSQLS